MKYRLQTIRESSTGKNQLFRDLVNGKSFTGEEIIWDIRYNRGSVYNDGYEIVSGPHGEYVRSRQDNGSGTKTARDYLG